MAGRHGYATTLRWTGNTARAPRRTGRTGGPARSSAAGKPAIAGSSDPHFRGDADRWNPEELLVAALSQCHLLAFLHEAATNGVVVVDYSDAAPGRWRPRGTAGG